MQDQNAIPKTRRSIPTSSVFVGRRECAQSPPRKSSPERCSSPVRPARSPQRARPVPSVPTLPMRSVTPIMASEDTFSRRLAAARNFNGCTHSRRPSSPPAHSFASGATGAVPDAWSMHEASGIKAHARALRGLETILCKASRDAADRAADRVAERADHREPRIAVEKTASRFSRSGKPRRIGELSSTTCSSASVSGRSSPAATPASSTNVSACASLCASAGGSASASAPASPGASPHRSPQATPLATPGASRTPSPSPPLSPVASPPDSPSHERYSHRGSPRSIDDTTMRVSYTIDDDASEVLRALPTSSPSAQLRAQLVAPPPRRPPSVSAALPLRQQRFFSESAPCATRRMAAFIATSVATDHSASACSSATQEYPAEGSDQESHAESTHEASMDADVALKLSCIPRIPELPRLHEERSLECTFQVTFLVPFGPEGRSFLENIRAAFREAPSAMAGSQAAAATNPDKSFLLVPYAGSRTALVHLQDIGPVQSLEHVRLRSQTNCRASEKFFSKAPPTPAWPAKALPEPTNEMCARSTALVYVVHATQCVDGMEQQLRPICAVEAFYAAAASDFLPHRSFAALQESGKPVQANASSPSQAMPARRHCPSFSGTEEIIQQLQHRRVPRLPCTNVMLGDSESHRNLLLNLVNSLAADFCLSARATADISQRTKAVDADTDTITPVTNLSRASSPKTTPSSSMLSAAQESPRYPERSERGASAGTTAGTSTSSVTLGATNIH